MTSTRPKSSTASPVNPRVSKHAAKRAHERFGIPLKRSHSWIINKLKEAWLIGTDGETRLYASNGVCIRVNHHTVVTVTQLNDEDIKKNNSILGSWNNGRQTTAKQGKGKGPKDRAGQAKVPVLPGANNQGDE